MNKTNIRIGYYAIFLTAIMITLGVANGCLENMQPTETEIPSLTDALSTESTPTTFINSVETTPRTPTPTESATLSPTVTETITPPLEDPRLSNVGGGLAGLWLKRTIQFNNLEEWGKAINLAFDILKLETASIQHICIAYTQLSYSYLHLELIDIGMNYLYTFNEECTNLISLPSDHWVFQDYAALQQEFETICEANQEIRSAQLSNDDFWQKADPTSLGLNITAIEEHEDLCQQSGADTCLVVYQGLIVSEWYRPNLCQVFFNAMSSTKSITALLVGMLIDDGKLASINDPVSQYIQGWQEGLRKQVTIYHLLTHTSGFPWFHEEGSVAEHFTSDSNTYVLSLSPENEPGTVFLYSNEGVQVLSPILDQAAGEPVQNYAQQQLFAPLSMEDTHFFLDGAGHALTYAGLMTTPRDFARIGLLILNRGVWQGKRIISESWLEQMLTPTYEEVVVYEQGVPTSTIIDDHGFLWWLKTDPYMFITRGSFDTNMYILPEEDLIVVRMQGVRRESNVSYEEEALQLFIEMVSSN